MSKIVQKFASDLDIEIKWKNIYISRNPLENPFNSNFKELVFFYPTDFYHLSQNQYESILKAANSIGEAIPQFRNSGDTYLIEPRTLTI